MTATTENTSSRLDSLLLLLMDQLESLQEKRGSFNALIEQGWFSLSKARYSMGNKCVSALQYGHEMAPLVYVKSSSLNKGQIEFCIERQDLKLPEETLPVEVIGPKEEGVRRRKTAQKIEEKNDVAQPEQAPHSNEKSESEKKAKSQHQDPLRWFGVLVPQTLKQAQSSFKEVIKLAAEIATLQTQIEATRAEFRTLLEQKQNLRKQRDI
ncbi:coiled-coil domain-containing protein 115 [Polypterus senegalus]|uniref:coiled-coil domain-containing protein 115 n=1 Tax=Polypterus senegalus TaxID=55291 RepID=UPI0019645640|nr:coiled-coil domain-containing protein 115 [Polypterus senegalus]